MELKVRLEAGLGDAVAASMVIKVLENHGHNITVSVNSNRTFVYECAGVPTTPMEPSVPFHRWRYYDDDWGDMSKPVWQSSKPMMAFRDDVFPKLEPASALWSELCAIRVSAREKIKPDVAKEVKSFLDGLPKPILALHTAGNSFASKKNLSHDVSIGVMDRWLQQTKGSIVQINADKGEPSHQHPHVKTHRSWRRIGLDWLCGLFYEADLMIGVDSGPFHLAAFTDVPCLGVFRQIQPIHCAIPNPNAHYLVSDLHHETWEKEKHDWQFIEYRGPEPDADDVFAAAMEVMTQP